MNIKTNDKFYTESLNAEEEALMRKKKSDNLKKAMRGRHKVKEAQEKTEEVINDSVLLENKNESKEKISVENERKDPVLSLNRRASNIKEQEIPSIFGKENKKKLPELDHVAETVNQEESEKEEEALINNIVHDTDNNVKLKEKEELKEHVIDIKEDIEEIKVEKKHNNEEIKPLEQENIYYDMFETSKIYFYAEMLDKLIGVEAENLELKSEKSFIQIIQDELEKILKKEDYKYINGIYKISSARTKFSNIMSELHKDKNFSEYIEKQSDLFMKQRPYRLNSINWIPLFKANIDNKAWLEDQQYAEVSNESLTPWTKTGALVWLIGIMIGGIGSYINYYYQKIDNPLNMMTPLIMVFSILLIISISDFMSNLLIKRKYKILKNLLIGIKNSVNEVVINKGDINPLMFDACSVYIKTKNKQEKRDKVN